MRCPKCGNMIFPRINPSVIVAVTHGDYLLLTKYANRPGAQRTALIAGFTRQGGRGLPQQEKLRIVYSKKIYQLAFRRKIAHAGKLGFRLGF